MKKNVGIFLVLALLAVLPVTCTFLFSGKNEDHVRAKSAVSATGAASRAKASAASEETTSPKRTEDAIPLSAAATAQGVPVFKGFEADRYQQYDAEIKRFCDDFNRNRKSWAGSTSDQADNIAQITPAQIKSHMIQETGGGDLNSRTAWKHDPLQVNVPGDWNPYKKYLGLKQPRRRNEGAGSQNLKAGLMLLVRKGFGRSGQPAGNQPSGTFDGWARALQRYNGRSDKAANGEPYSEAYSARIRKRAEDPSVEVPIPIPVKK